ncbi:hypothetical protein POX_d04809 [Penicillium oxalicum]|uniref:hypothetical protein n=1 Tax=Penicillium oxalicum TaxID=69781 RepID=UPI0020B78840|nr:hypothetical protein POX_d04809 [Penicillium oxalicum]KAI2789322.1 hypothetical protein POX_d04809 [Penicillium oxalicum]
MKTTAICVSLLAVGASAHMQMMKPYPIRSPLNKDSSEQKDYSYTNPLDSSGSNFPCKGYANDPFTSQASYSPGQTYELELDGSAVHGGGSCQISLTYDRGKTFKVIESMLGECPISKNYSFQIPSDAPSGEALLAWTWFNKVGNREMYMNCAMVTIGGSTTKGTKSDPDRVNTQSADSSFWPNEYKNHTFHGPPGHHGHPGHRPQVPGMVPREVSEAAMAMDSSISSATTAFDSRPAMFVANVNQAGGCVTVEGEEVDFPQPGPNVVGKIDTSGKGYKCSGDAPFLSSGTGSTGGSSGSSSSAAPSTLATSAAPATSSSSMSSSSTNAPEAKGTSSSSASPATSDTPASAASTTATSGSDTTADGTMISLAQLAQLVSSLSSAAAAPTADNRVTGDLHHEVASTNAAFSSYVEQWPCGVGELLCSPDGSTWAMCSNGRPIYMGPVARGMSCQLGHMVRAA